MLLNTLLSRAGGRELLDINNVFLYLNEGREFSSFRWLNTAAPWWGHVVEQNPEGGGQLIMDDVGPSD